MLDMSGMGSMGMGMNQHHHPLGMGMGMGVGMGMGMGVGMGMGQPVPALPPMGIPMGMGIGMVAAPGFDGSGFNWSGGGVGNVGMQMWMLMQAPGGQFHTYTVDSSGGGGSLWQAAVGGGYGGMGGYEADSLANMSSGGMSGIGMGNMGMGNMDKTSLAGPRFGLGFGGNLQCETLLVTCTILVQEHISVTGQPSSLQVG